MVDIRSDIRYVISFFREKKSRLVYGLISFLFLLYILVGLITITTTRTLSYVLDFSGWAHYIVKLPLQLEYRMSLIASVFFVLTLIVISLYFIIAYTQIHHIKKYHLKAGSAVGIMTLLGIGCASCGAVVLTSFLGVFGVTGLITIFPLHGGEFQILAFVIALISLHVLIQKVQRNTCDITDLT